MSKQYKVWDCRIIVEVSDKGLPNGFDFPPRRAAIDAIENAGIGVVMCSSGWGGTMNDGDKEFIRFHSKDGADGVYIAGLMDTPEDTAH